MINDRKQKLIDLGPDTLAEALLELAPQSDAAEALIERLTASPQENTQRFKAELAALKRSRRFIDWRESPEFTRKLKGLLQDVKAGVTDSLTGVKLVAAFYEADEGILGHSDDSNGFVGDIFRYDAKQLFVEYASSCTEKEKIAEVLIKLNQENAHGVRDLLIDCAGDYLPVPVIRSMITGLQKQADGESEEDSKRPFLRPIESLARQIKDAPLFEKTRIASWGTLSTAALVDIARVYLESGDVETAHSRLKKIPKKETFQAQERDQLLLEIYRQKGDKEKLTDLLHQNFQSSRSKDTLQELLDVLGEEKRNEVISAEVELILKSPSLKASDAEFLISLEKVDEAEAYLLKRADLLNGDYYESLISLAEDMEFEERHLAASLLYRSLLVSVLTRGYIKAYPYGVQYLKKLDKMAPAITDWKSFQDHRAFKAQIAQDHGRKHSFWSKYDAKK